MSKEKTVIVEKDQIKDNKKKVLGLGRKISQNRYSLLGLPCELLGKGSKVLVSSQMEIFLGQSRATYVKVSVFQPTGNIRTPPLETVIEEPILYSR